MKILTTLLLTLMLATPASAAEYVIDKKGQHAYIIFKASHLGYSYIIGHFEDFNGSFSYDPANPSASAVNITIKSQSLDSDHAERDKHLRGSDYFDVTKHPTITFKSTGFTGSAEEGVIAGDLTLKGVTRSVNINARKIGEGKDPWGGYRSGFEGTLEVKAGDYNLPAWIGPVSIELIVEGIRQ